MSVKTTKNRDQLRTGLLSGLCTGELGGADDDDLEVKKVV